MNAPRDRRRAAWYAASEAWFQWSWGVAVGYAAGEAGWSFAVPLALAAMASVIVARHIKHKRDMLEDDPPSHGEPGPPRP